MQSFNDKQTFYFIKQKLDQCLKIIQFHLFQYTRKKYNFTIMKQTYEISTQ
jgi:hypothetical protein